MFCFEERSFKVLVSRIYVQTSAVSLFLHFRRVGCWNLDCACVLDMRAFDELRKLEMFFKEEARRNCSIIDLYELVQHAGNILPRL